jgi:hypothetical protein
VRWHFAYHALSYKGWRSLSNLRHQRKTADDRGRAA